MVSSVSRCNGKYFWVFQVLVSVVLLVLDFIKCRYYRVTTPLTYHNGKSVEILVFLSEQKTISKVVGSTVNLYCKNESLSEVSQVTWTKNETKLLSWMPSTTHWYPEAYNLHINISVSQDNGHTLTIESVQEAHAGNYTCETTALSGVWEEKWMLIITGVPIINSFCVALNPENIH